MEPDVGVPLELIEEHTNLLNQIVNQMMEDMTQESRILEGTELPDYAALRDQLDKENELSEGKEDMTQESRILEGTELPDYAALRDQLDKENELSEGKEDKQ